MFIQFPAVHVLYSSRREFAESISVKLPTWKIQNQLQKYFMMGMGIYFHQNNFNWGGSVTK